MGHSAPKGKFSSNLISNIAFFIINIIVSLWFTAYLVRHLGLAAYGLVPLVITITSYFNVLTLGLNVAVGRHMTIALELADDLEVSKIFNSSFWAMTGISALILFLGVIISPFLYTWINIPKGYEIPTVQLFIFAILSFFITSINSSFNIVAYCRNHFGLQNTGNFLGLLAKVILVILLFHYFPPNLWQVGAAISSAALATCLFSIWSCHYLLPQLRINIKDFNYAILKKISHTGIWVVINQIGTILIVNIDLLVANKLEGSQEAGKYALVLQWSLLLRNFALVATGVFGPTILYYFAQKKITDLINYSKKAVKLLGLLVALPVGLICGFSKQILHIWLGASFENLSLLLIILTGHLALNLAYLPLSHISMATNKVKWPAISQIIAGIANLILAVCLGLKFHLYGIAMAGVIVLFIRNMIFTPFYTAHIIKIPAWTFVIEALPIALLTVCIGFASWGISKLYPINSWSHLILSGLIINIFYILFVWNILLNNEERTLITHKFLGKGIEA